MAISRAVDDPDSTRNDLVDDVVDSGCPAHDSDAARVGQRVSGEPFDAFDASTWDLKPPTTPWHHTKLAVGTTVAAGLAAATLVVSVVLVAFRGSSEVTRIPPVESSSTVDSSSAAVVVPPAASLTPPAPVGVPPPPPQVDPTDAPVIAQPSYRPPTPQQQTPSTHVTREPTKPRATNAPVRATPARTPGS